MALFDMNAGNTKRASQMMVSAENYLTNALVHWADQIESWQTGKSMAQISDARDAKVAREEMQEREGAQFKARQESGAAMLSGPVGTRTSDSRSRWTPMTRPFSPQTPR